MPLNSPMRLLLFRCAATAWAANGIARPALFATNAFGFASAWGASIGLSVVGAAIGIAVGAFLWLRPGRPSAVTAVVVGLYIVPTMLYIPFVGRPIWLLVLIALGLLAFGLSIACVLQTRRWPAGYGSGPHRPSSTSPPKN